MASEAADRTIDELLERYLDLLDQHATLRASLAATQQDTLHSLARANFSAPRGARYGPDQYDARMQASRRVVIAGEDKSAPPTFTVTEEDDAVVGSTREGGGGGGGEEGAGKDAAAARDDPIRWFGVLVPQALRDAQSHARRAVQDVIPRLASVQAEIAHVEIEVRRARKRRAKASSGGGSQKQDVVGSTAQTVSASS
ncbi:hypothetical protein ACQRIT_005443 [Beauveria bassiana]